MAHWRCGGSLVVLQTTEAVVVPGSNPASLTVEKLRGQAESLCMYTVKSRGRGGPPTVTQKNIEKNIFKKGSNASLLAKSCSSHWPVISKFSYSSTGTLIA